jgi:hypothetical protein
LVNISSWEVNFINFKLAIVYFLVNQYKKKIENLNDKLENSLIANIELESKLKLLETELDKLKNERVSSSEKRHRDVEFSSDNLSLFADDPVAKRACKKQINSKVAKTLEREVIDKSASAPVEPARLLDIRKDPIDTKQFAQEFRFLLRSHFITQAVFSKEILGITVGRFEDMLSNPRPWETCTRYTKTLLHKMYVWAKSPEAIQTLKYIHVNEGGAEKLNANKNEEPLDTAKVVKRVEELLEEHGIIKEKFGKAILDLGIKHTRYIMRKVPTWEKCTANRRFQYRQMHEWTISEESIMALKENKL